MAKRQMTFRAPPKRMTDEEYSRLWKRYGPIRIRMIEKAGARI